MRRRRRSIGPACSAGQGDGDNALFAGDDADGGSVCRAMDVALFWQDTPPELGHQRPYPLTRRGDPCSAHPLKIAAADAPALDIFRCGMGAARRAVHYLKKGRGAPDRSSPGEAVSARLAS